MRTTVTPWAIGIPMSGNAVRLDDDIAALDMSELEKHGLQVYRNYSRSFMQMREKQFAKAIDESPPDIHELEHVISLLLEEDIRFVPVIACAFADDELKTMFNSFLREGIPGGKKAMVGRFGPISSLYARIQFAYAFDMMNHDILGPLDKLRSQRKQAFAHMEFCTAVRFFQRPLASDGWA